MRTFEEGANHTTVCKDGFSRQSSDGTTTLMKKLWKN